MANAIFQTDADEKSFRSLAYGGIHASRNASTEEYVFKSVQLGR